MKSLSNYLPVFMALQVFVIVGANAFGAEKTCSYYYQTYAGEAFPQYFPMSQSAGAFVANGNRFSYWTAFGSVENPRSIVMVYLLDDHNRKINRASYLCE